MIRHHFDKTQPLTTKHVDIIIMSRPSSTLDEEPCVIVSPTRDRDEAGSESDTTTDDEEKSVVSVNKKFKDIMNDLKNGSFDPCDAAKLEHFAAHNASYLGQKMTADSDHNTLLHLLVVEAKDKVINKYKPLVKLLIDRHPNLLGEKDSNEKTPLYIAISKKRDKLVRFMCDIHHKIDDILSIPCYRCKNCLHIAVQKDIPKLATFLISRASEGTLCAKDDKGNTPLHLAVDYKRCTDAQLGIVHALTLQCDRAMDARTSAPDAFSPFRYHEHTRAGAKTAKEKEKESSQRKKDEASAAGMDGLAEKDAVGVKPKFATQALDMKTQKPVGPKEQGAETDKTNMSNEAPLRKYGGAGGIYSGSGLMGGGYRNAGLEFESSIEGLVNSNGKGSNPRTPVMPIANPRQEREKEKAKVTEESAAAIRDYLKLHYMRTRNHDETVDFLYGRNQGESLLSVLPRSKVYLLQHRY